MRLQANTNRTPQTRQVQRRSSPSWYNKTNPERRHTIECLRHYTPPHLRGHQCTICTPHCMRRPLQPRAAHTCHRYRSDTQYLHSPRSRCTIGSPQGSRLHHRLVHRWYLRPHTDSGSLEVRGSSLRCLLSNSTNAMDSGFRDSRSGKQRRVLDTMSPMSRCNIRYNCSQCSRYRLAYRPGTIVRS